MRFRIRREDGPPGFLGGMVVTADDFDALEIEIETACCDCCHRCELSDTFSPAVRKHTGDWLHIQFDAPNDGPLKCDASPIRERRYQRLLLTGRDA
jgi:hypothetical protein